MFLMGPKQSATRATIPERCVANAGKTKIK